MYRYILSIPLALALSASSTALAGEVQRADYGDVRLMPTSTVVHASTQATGPSDSPDAARALGAKWLVQVQHTDGGWGSGGHGQADLAAASDVATTAMAVLALLRDANGTAQHRADIEEGVRFVIKAVEDGPANSPAVATPAGTQPQYKLGKLVDTHMAALMLSEVNGKLSDALNKEVSVAIDAALTKVQLAQNADGSFETDGWAPVLSNSVASMALSNARAQGYDVSEAVLAQAEVYQNSGVGTGGGGFDAKDGAGVELYAVAGALGSMSKRAKDKEASTNSAPATQKAAEERVANYADQLISGFGSIGGEEMLSYMMVSDSLAEEGGEGWDNWSKKIGDYLINIQNQDGSWVGHHCITSRVFVTATAVMALGAENHAKLNKAKEQG